MSKARKPGLVATLGRAAISHRRLVAVGWVLVLVVALGAASAPVRMGWPRAAARRLTAQEAMPSPW